MKPTLLVLLVVSTMAPFGTAQNLEYEVPIQIVRKGHANQPIANIQIGPKPYHDSRIFGAVPGNTDALGNATIRFNSPARRVKVNYRVIEGPDGAEWFVKFHGFYPNGTADVPPHDPSARPVVNSVLKMEAYPASEAAAVADEELTAGRTGMIGAAVASAVTISPTEKPSDGAKLNDPLRSYEKVATILQTTSDVAKNLVTKWQTVVDAAPGNSKLDEKALSALCRGDLKAASKFAKMAEDLTSQQKGQLVAMSDTGRLVETTYQLSVAALKDSGIFPNPTADRNLKVVKETIKPLRPREATKGSSEREISSRDNARDTSNLKEFSKTAREAASRN